jgi:hypothetical protein
MRYSRSIDSREATGTKFVTFLAILTEIRVSGNQIFFDEGVEIVRNGKHRSLNNFKSNNFEAVLIYTTLFGG